MSQRRSRHSGHRRRRHSSRSSSDRSQSPRDRIRGRRSPRHDIRKLIQEHEHELDEINDYRSRSVASFAASKTAEVEHLKAQQVQIRSDFAYNLKLLEERDAELDRYDALFSKLSTQLKKRDQEVTRLNDVVQEQANAIAAFQEQLGLLHEKHRKEIFERDHELETLTKNHHEQMLSHHNVINALKNDHVAECNAKSRQFETEIEDMKMYYEKQISELNRTHRTEMMKLQRGLNEQQKESQDEIEDLKAKLRLTANSTQEQSIFVQNLICDKDEHIRALEEENGKLVEMKHELLLQYEQKIGEVLHSLHELEQQFGQQRVEFQTRLQQLSSERDRLVNDLKQTQEYSNKEIDDLRAKLSTNDQVSKDLSDRLDESNRRLAKQMQDGANAITELEQKLSALQQMIDVRDHHVVLLKDLIRNQNENIHTSEQANTDQQHQADIDLYQKVSQAQERLENLIHSLLNSDSTGSVASAANLAEQADNITELQSGLMSIKKSIHSRASTSRASSRRPSLMSTLPRAEQILAEIPDTTSISDYSRRLSSTVVRPMDVEIINPTAANMTVDGASPEKSGLQQVVELSTDDEDIVSSQHDRSGSVLSNLSEIVSQNDVGITKERPRSASFAHSRQQSTSEHEELISPLSQCSINPVDSPQSKEYQRRESKTSSNGSRRSSSLSNLSGRRRTSSSLPILNRDWSIKDSSKFGENVNSFDLKKVNVDKVEVEETKDMNSHGNNSEKTIRSRKASRGIGSASAGLETVREDIDGDACINQLSSSDIVELDQVEMSSSLQQPAVEIHLPGTQSQQIFEKTKRPRQLLSEQTSVIASITPRQMHDQITISDGLALAMESTGCQTLAAPSPAENISCPTNTQEDDTTQSRETALLQEMEICKDEIKQQAMVIELLKKQVSKRADHEECQKRITKLESELERCSGELQDSRLESQERESQAVRKLDVLKLELERIRNRSQSKDRGTDPLLPDLAVVYSAEQVEELQARLHLLEKQNHNLNQQLTNAIDEDHRFEGERILAEFEKLRQHNSDAFVSSRSHNDEKLQLIKQENEKLREIVQDMKQELGSIQEMQQSMSNEMSNLKQTKKDQERHIESLVNLIDNSTPERAANNDILKYLNQIDATNTKLVEMSERLTESDRKLLQKGQQHKQKIRQYENELQELKHELRVAQKDLQRQQNRQASLQPGIESSEIYLDEINHLSNKMKESSHLLLQYREARDLALEQLRKVESERDNLRIQLDQQFRLVDILKNRIATADLTMKPTSRVGSDKLAALSKENEDLRTRLEEAKSDLSHLDAEKDKLMEISNMLKANISKLTSDEAVMSIPVSHIDLNSEVTNIYNAKIANHERALRDVMRQNQSLKAQLRNFISNENNGLTLHRHPGSSEYCTDSLCQWRYIYSLNSALNTRDNFKSEIASNIDKLDQDIQKSLKATSTPIVVSDITREPLGEIDTVPSPQSIPESRARQRLRHELDDLIRVANEDKRLHSAKRNFKTVREAMTMSGRGLSLHPIPCDTAHIANIEEREREHQQRRVRDTKKRATLMRQRQAIRNYNDKD